MKVSKGLRTVLNVLSWLLTAVVVLVLCMNLYMIAASRLFGVRMPTVCGYSSAIVLSGSMEDAIHVDDMVINHRQKTYEVLDIVTYLPKDSGTAVTHRIVSVSGDQIITQGDANNAADPAITADQIVGKVVKIIPGVGKAVQKLQSPLGMLLLLLVGLLLIKLPDWLALLAKHKKEKKEPSSGE